MFGIILSAVLSVILESTVGGGLKTFVHLLPHTVGVVTTINQLFKQFQFAKNITFLIS